MEECRRHRQRQAGVHERRRMGTAVHSFPVPADPAGQHGLLTDPVQRMDCEFLE